MIRDISEDTQRRVLEINPRYEDNISKRMADIRLSPWRGQELDTEYRTSQEARARINVSVIFMYFKKKCLFLNFLPLPQQKLGLK